MRATACHHATHHTVFVTMQGSNQLLQVILCCSTPGYSFHVQEGDEALMEIIVRQDLARSRLGEAIVRFMPIKNGLTRHRLIMQVSHTQYGGAPMPLLMQNLQTAYRGQRVKKRSQFKHLVRMQPCNSQGQRSPTPTCCQDLA